MTATASHARMLHVKFRRERVTRHAWFDGVPSPEAVLDGMELDPAGIGADSWSGFSALLERWIAEADDGARDVIGALPCGFFRQIGDWTLTTECVIPHE